MSVQIGFAHWSKLVSYREGWTSKIENTRKKYWKNCCKVSPENVPHWGPMISEGKDQNSDSDDFENDRYTKKCKPAP